ncbi:MAG: hypothetical protein M1825_003922 [Sarcosagium campestre]|nr:MAG: hypothetical protein M1825_003922 [Sarcosagium campestre]
MQGSTDDGASRPSQAPVPTPHPIGEADDDGDEWEYEYDENATDTFYLTLDLTPFSELPKLSTTQPEAEDKPDDASPEPDGNEAPDASVVSSDNNQSEHDGNGAKEEASPMMPDPIQILDLHSSNPIISYKNQLYSCEWSRNVGTELLLTVPTKDQNNDQALPALHVTPRYSILAACSHRLTSTPTQLEPRGDTAATDHLPLFDDDSGNNITSEGFSIPESKIIPIGPGATQGRHNQARFLERLQAVKDRRGERDEVTVYAKALHTTGSGWRSQERMRIEEKEELRRRIAAGDQEAVELLRAYERNELVPHEHDPENTRQKRPYKKRGPRSKVPKVGEFLNSAGRPPGPVSEADQGHHAGEVVQIVAPSPPLESVSALAQSPGRVISKDTVMPDAAPPDARTSSDSHSNG